MGEPQAAHTGDKFCQTRPMALTTSMCTTKLGMNAKITTSAGLNSDSTWCPLHTSWAYLKLLYTT